MAHHINLTINNSTTKVLYLDEVWFWKGNLDGSQVFPKTIVAGATTTVKSKGSSHCSGYVSYITGNSRITIGFSNPSSGRNKLGIGLTGIKVWDDMTDHGYKLFTEILQLNDSSVITCQCKCTGTDTNVATVTLVGH